MRPRTTLTERRQKLARLCLVQRQLQRLWDHWEKWHDDPVMSLSATSYCRTRVLMEPFCRCFGDQQNANPNPLHRSHRHARTASLRLRRASPRRAPPSHLHDPIGARHPRIRRLLPRRVHRPHRHRAEVPQRSLRHPRCWPRPVRARTRSPLGVRVCSCRRRIGMVYNIFRSSGKITAPAADRLHVGRLVAATLSSNPLVVSPVASCR